LPHASLLQSLFNVKNAEQNRNDCNDQKDEKKDFGNFGGPYCDPTKPEKGSDQGYYKKD
jgi:hypothetical protein